MGALSAYQPGAQAPAVGAAGGNVDHFARCARWPELALRAGIFLALIAPTLAAADAPLADAVEHGEAATIATLLAADADPDAAQPDGMTALHWAVHRDDEPLAARLIAAGADAEAATHYGVTPLSLACVNGNGAIVRRLLAAGADPQGSRAGGESLLMIAARTGRPGAVRALLGAGAKVDHRDGRGQTALMWASAAGNVEAIGLLLDAGADATASEASGFTPFLFAIREGRIGAANRLIAAGADANGSARVEKPTRGGLRDGATPLLLAVENGHFELAGALLDAGADPNDARPGATALHALSWVRKPLRGDGDPPPTGSGDWTSLDLVRSLIDHGADVNRRLAKNPPGHPGLNKQGATPFLLACETGDVPLMRLLLKRNADPEIPNVDGTTALLAAAGVGALGSGDEPAATEEEALDAVRLLLDLGADIDAVDERGETAMHGAAYKNRPAMVALLAERGADRSIWDRKNRSGWTPLLIARGHRRGNFRPSPETVAALHAITEPDPTDPTR